MMTRTTSTRLQLASAASLLMLSLGAHAQREIKDTLTGTSSSFDWKVINGACLTAGDGTGTIPACVGLPYYNGKTLVGGTSGRLPDLNKQGALRLSNGDTGLGTNGNNQTGAILSNFTFPLTDGIQVTWTSVSYGGNNYSGTGADGIAFFLSDGGQAASIGAFGGSLGYSCANGKDPSDGVVGGYIGIGIDEYGNFANPGDNTDTDSSIGFSPGRISMRGAGSTAWSWLHNSPLYSKYYTGTVPNATAVQKTCATGYAWNYSGSNKVDSTSHTIGNGQQTGDKLDYNYKVMFSQPFEGNGVSIANQEAVNMPTRGAATPIIFALKITSDGLLDFSYSVNGGATTTVASGVSIIASNGPLPATVRFGFSSGTGGGSNVHEITCFKASPVNLANSTAGSNAQQATQIVIGGAQVFLAYYHPLNWWGTLTANTLAYDGTLNRLVLQTNSNWDGNCVLSGGACTAMGTTATVSAQSPGSRNILTWNNRTTAGAGIPFEWSNLTGAEKTALGNSSDRLDYLRGERSKEIGNGGSFRNRTSVLGDIIDSGPTWVGPPAFEYTDPWVDKLATSTTMPEGSTSYAAFQTTNASRMNVVYSGSNDGLLHGFRAGIIAADGKTIASNDGQELLAYMPGQVINSINPASASFAYSSTAYVHNFQVDATPGYGDLYYNNAWHTWLVSGLGPGGHPGGPVNSNGTNPVTGTQLIPNPVGAIFALDITNPNNFKESNASSLVIGEWNSSTISCTDNATCGTNLGQVYGMPAVRRLHDGSWGVIFGNGLNSATARAGLFIMHVSTTGVKTFQYIDAGPGPANGIMELTAADLDGDHVTDFVYAGDVAGNLWRFDLTSATSTSWTAVKMFSAASNQPISTAPIVAEIPAGNSSGKSKLIITFGTGQKLPLTSASSEVYASGTQSVYGIWDANLSDWNATTTDEKYDSIVSPALPVLTTTLAVRTASNIPNATYRSVTPVDGTICWAGSTICSSGNTQMGYKMDLPGDGEQVIYNPTLIDDSFVYNTTIPESNQPLTCGNTPASGYTMATSIINGSGDNSPFSDGTTNYSGIALNGTGSVSEFHYNNQNYGGTETRDGGWVSVPWPPRGGVISRITWTKVR